MKAILLLLAALPCAAQFREIEFRFVPTPCESCTASVPGRMSKVRGVESAELTGTGVLKVKLAAENRARLEMLRDMIEQDGTKVKSAAVTVAGTMEKQDDAWVMRPVPNGITLRLGLTEGQLQAAKPDRVLIRGEIREMPPRQEPAALHVASITPIP